MSTISLRRIAVVLGLIGGVTLGACSDDVAGPAASSSVHVRVVNSLYRGTVAASAVARPIDYLFDSLTVAPSVLALAANAVSSGDSANGYRTLPVGRHSFVARLAGDTTRGASLYTNSVNLPFLPVQYLTAGMYYTVVVAGVIPDSGTAVPSSAVPVSILADDPFSGPVLHDAAQARFTVINAAPYAAASGAGASVSVYVWPGSTPPPGVITTYAAQATTSYRFRTRAINVNAGSYVITIAAGATILAQQTVTFAAGDVRTLVLQSTGPVTDQAHHQLTVWPDHNAAP